MTTISEDDPEVLRRALLVLHRDAARLRGHNAELVAANLDLVAQLTEATQVGGKHLRTLVAFHQLLDGTDVVAGLRNVEDILVNIVGTEDFVIVSGLRHKTARVVAGMGPAVARARSGSRTLDELARDALREIPLSLCGRAVGAVLIDSLLPHRDGFTQADEDVLHLLHRHAAMAILAAAEWRRWAQLRWPEPA